MAEVGARSSRFKVEASRSWREEFEKTAFGILYVMLKESGVKRRLVFLGIAVDLFQMLAFPLHERFASWGADLALPKLQGFLELFVAKVYLESANSDGFLAIYIIVTIFVYLALLDAVFVGYEHYRNDFQYLWPVRVLRGAVSLLVTILYIPFLTTLINVCIRANCIAPQLLALMLFGLLAAVLLVAFSMAMALVYFESKPESNGLSARAHARVQFFILAQKTFLVFTFTFLHGDTWNMILSLIMVLGAVCIVVAWIVLQPFYRDWRNWLVAGLYSVYMWACITMMLSEYGVLASSPAGITPPMLLYLGFFPCFSLGFSLAWSVSMYYRYQLQSNGLASVQSILLPTPLHAEIAVRSIRAESALATAVFERAVRKFPQSSYLWLSYGLHLNAMEESPTKVERAMKRASMHRPWFDVRFQVFRYSMDKARSSKSSETGAMDLMTYLEYKKEQGRATRSHKTTIRTIRKFWTVVSSDSVDFAQLQRISKAIAVNASTAERSYVALIRKFPMSPMIMRSYGHFLHHVRNDVMTADEYFGRARSIEAEMKKRAEASSSTMRMGEDRPFFAVDATGRIRMASSQLAHMFGHKRKKLLNQSLGVLLPAPVTQTHEEHFKAYFRKWQRALQSDNEERNDPAFQSRPLIARHANGALFLMHLTLQNQESELEDTDTLDEGLENSSASADLIVFAQVDQTPQDSDANATPLLFVDPPTKSVVGATLAAEHLLGYPGSHLQGMFLHLLIPNIADFDTLAGGPQLDAMVQTPKHEAACRVTLLPARAGMAVLQLQRKTDGASGVPGSAAGAGVSGSSAGPGSGGIGTRRVSMREDDPRTRLEALADRIDGKDDATGGSGNAASAAGALSKREARQHTRLQRTLLQRSKESQKSVGVIRSTLLIVVLLCIVLVGATFVIAEWSIQDTIAGSDLMSTATQRMAGVANLAVAVRELPVIVARNASDTSGFAAQLDRIQRQLESIDDIEDRLFNDPIGGDLVAGPALAMLHFTTQSPDQGTSSPVADKQHEASMFNGTVVASSTTLVNAIEDLSQRTQALLQEPASAFAAEALPSLTDYLFVAHNGVHNVRTGLLQSAATFHTRVAQRSIALGQIALVGLALAVAAIIALNWLSLRPTVLMLEREKAAIIGVFMHLDSGMCLEFARATKASFDELEDEGDDSDDDEDDLDDVLDGDTVFDDAGAAGAAGGTAGVAGAGSGIAAGAAAAAGPGFAGAAGAMRRDGLAEREIVNSSGAGAALHMRYGGVAMVVLVLYCAFFASMVSVYHSSNSAHSQLLVSAERELAAYDVHFWGREVSWPTWSSIAASGSAELARLLDLALSQLDTLHTSLVTDASVQQQQQLYFDDACTSWYACDAGDTDTQIGSSASVTGYAEIASARGLHTAVHLFSTGYRALRFYSSQAVDAVQRRASNAHAVVSGMHQAGVEELVHSGLRESTMQQSVLIGADIAQRRASLTNQMIALLAFLAVAYVAVYRPLLYFLNSEIQSIHFMLTIIPIEAFSRSASLRRKLRDDAASSRSQGKHDNDAAYTDHITTWIRAFAAAAATPSDATAAASGRDADMSSVGSDASPATTPSVAAGPPKAPARPASLSLAGGAGAGGRWKTAIVKAKVVSSMSSAPEEEAQRRMAAAARAAARDYLREFALSMRQSLPAVLRPCRYSSDPVTFLGSLIASGVVVWIVATVVYGSIWQSWDHRPDAWPQRMLAGIASLVVGVTPFCGDIVVTPLVRLVSPDLPLQLVRDLALLHRPLELACASLVMWFIGAPFSPLALRWCVLGSIVGTLPGVAVSHVLFVDVSILPTSAWAAACFAVVLWRRQKLSAFTSIQNPSSNVPFELFFISALGGMLSSMFATGVAPITALLLTVYWRIDVRVAITTATLTALPQSLLWLAARAVDTAAPIAPDALAIARWAVPLILVAAATSALVLPRMSENTVWSVTGSSISMALVLQAGLVASNLDVTTAALAATSLVVMFGTIHLVLVGGSMRLLSR